MANRPPVDYLHRYIQETQGDRLLERLWAEFLSAAQIQLISGQESKKSLEVYQHLSPDAVGMLTREPSRTSGCDRLLCPW
jgi:hypothetical protein